MKPKDWKSGDWLLCVSDRHANSPAFPIKAGCFYQIKQTDHMRIAGHVVLTHCNVQWISDRFIHVSESNITDLEKLLYGI